MSLTDELRAAIKSSGLSLYRIAKDTHTPYSVVYRFANGERQLKLDTADKLIDYLGIKLMCPKRLQR